MIIIHFCTKQIERSADYTYGGREPNNGMKDFNANMNCGQIKRWVESVNIYNFSVIHSTYAKIGQISIHRLESFPIYRVCEKLIEVYLGAYIFPGPVTSSSPAPSTKACGFCAQCCLLNIKYTVHASC